MKVEVEKNAASIVETNDTADLEAFLLNGPTFSKKQIEVVEENRKAINKWRAK